MNNCPDCGGPTIEGFTERYCAQECDLRVPSSGFATPGSTVPAWTKSIFEGNLYLQLLSDSGTRCSSPTPVRFYPRDNGYTNDAEVIVAVCTDAVKIVSFVLDDAGGNPLFLGTKIPFPLHANRGDDVSFPAGELRVDFS